MIVRYLLCVLLFLTVRGISFSQGSYGSNISVISRMLDESVLPVENELILVGKEKLYNLSVRSSNEYRSFFIPYIKGKLGDFRILTEADTTGISDSIDYSIIFSEININTKYREVYTDNVFGTKKIKRSVTVTYRTEIKEFKSSKVVFSKNYSNKTEDSFNLDEKDQVEDIRYSFSAAKLPEESTLNQFLFPAAIIIASAAAIVLFFTIRSK
jgi:hypothetical protein